ncbi:LCP family protein [Streptomyces sp. NPDC127074]|uniref:LCP family protein n=1 Tax=Streptomyces sp. NPDC127074 TaxID=3347130 RepID=UPI00365111A4
MGRRGGGRGRKWAAATAVVLATVLTGGLGTVVWADSELRRDVDLGAIPDRPPHGRGTTYLIVGSDSRAGLSAREKKNLHVGSAEGRRTDSMILLHTGAHGATMVSLPRDSWVTVPAWVRPETGVHHRAARDKLNAAYAHGGPALLVRTVERATGLRIDHYAEIGFQGFVDVVNEAGGVRMCVDRNIRDRDSGTDLRKGCHTLDGAQALAFVRQRHQEAKGDLGRTMNQQKFLGALAAKVVTPDVLLAPATLYPVLGAALDTLVVDKEMGMGDLVSLLRALGGGNAVRLNVPVSAVGIPTSRGSAIRWDADKARGLFTALREDRPARPGKGA